jgi:2-dehydro-3-deoxyglucarate aldolase/4-hydroxy-2-oxoheptanedioate aldolase
MPALMKPNRFKQKLAEGKVPVGHMLLEFGVRSIPRLLQNAGVDFVLIDNEHSAFSTSEVADLIAWFRATEIAPFVRVPEVQYHLIARTLDLGAQGVMVPNVKNAAEARAIVDAAKYAPLGKRGVIMGNANTDFQSLAPADFLVEANRTTTIICQIESVEGVENVEAIASTPGVDVLWVGHFDLTQSQGIPGQFHHDRFFDAVAKVIAAARKHQLGAGIQPGSVAQAEEWMKLGFNVISYSADYAIYTAALAAGVDEVQKLATRITA